MLKVHAYTQGKNVPSSRFRIRQFTQLFGEHGVALREFYCSATSYPPREIWSRPFWAVKNLAGNFLNVFPAKDCDLTIIQREFFSKHITFEKMTSTPRILDVDDAIWIHSESTAMKLAEISDAVVCGNSFLANKFSNWNPNIHILPTAIDTDRYGYMPYNPQTKIICWSGTSGGFYFLHQLENVFSKLISRYPDLRIRIVSDRPLTMPSIQSHIDNYKWTPADEVRHLQESNIGIMPLADDVRSKGKCSFKMLTYMSVGRPVVVSPIGMNREVLEMGKVGMGASSDQAWLEALSFYLDNPKDAGHDGINGRQIITNDFSLQVIGLRWLEIINKCK